MSDTFKRDEARQSEDADRMLSKIRKLLAKASAEGCSEAERNSLNTKAAELCAKYGIDQARAAAAGNGGERGELSLSPYTFYDATHKAQAVLMYRIAEALACQAILTAGDADYDSTGLTVIGYLADVERAEMFFESLFLQMISGAMRVQRAARPSFMDGFAAEIGERIEAAESKAKADEAPEGSSTALVLASREVAVREAYRKEFPHISHSRAVSRNVNGYAAGVAAGRQANLGGKSVGSQRAALAS